MNQSIRDRLIAVNAELIREGAAVAASQFRTGVIGSPTYVDLQALHRWWGKVQSFGYQLGRAAKPWRQFLSEDPKRNTLAFVQRALGTLEAIASELEDDHLHTFTALVRSETLADLLDQAQHLFDAGYGLAAGVLGRAVLEEHLRSTCEALNCQPEKARATIKDLNQALYAAEHYSKTQMKRIDMLASIGNDAAHNKPDLEAEDVKRLLADLPAIIEATGA